MKIPKTVFRMLAAFALLCASAQSHAGIGFCVPAAPSLSSTQTSSGGVFTIDISAFSGGCVSGPSFLDAPLTSFSLPYFSDSHSTISAPTGWTWEIVQGDLLSPFAPNPAAQTLVFTASSEAAGVAPRSTLSGFLLTSAYSGVATTVYAANTTGIYSAEYTIRSGSMPLIAGSPDAREAFGLPASPVPEPSTWAMLALGLVVATAARARLNRRQSSALMGESLSTI